MPAPSFLLTRKRRPRPRPPTDDDETDARNRRPPAASSDAASTSIGLYWWWGWFWWNHRVGVSGWMVCGQACPRSKQDARAVVFQVFGESGRLFRRASECSDGGTFRGQHQPAQFTYWSIPIEIESNRPQIDRFGPVVRENSGPPAASKVRSYDIHPSIYLTQVNLDITTIHPTHKRQLARNGRGREQRRQRQDGRGKPGAGGDCGQADGGRLAHHARGRGGQGGLVGWMVI